MSTILNNIVHRHFNTYLNIFIRRQNTDEILIQYISFRQATMLKMLVTFGNKKIKIDCLCLEVFPRKYFILNSDLLEHTLTPADPMSSIKY